MGVVSLGQRVRDRVTGFTGIVVARTEYLYDEASCGIEAEHLDDGGMPPTRQWFSEPRLEVVERDTRVTGFVPSAPSNESEVEA